MPDELKKLLFLRGLIDEPTKDMQKKLPLVETLNTPGGSVRVPHAAPFQPYPEVIGGTGLANKVAMLLREAPSLQGHVKSVQYGPTEDVMNELIPEKLNENDFELTNLLGVTNMDSKRVSLNPALDLNDHINTIMKQLGDNAKPEDELPLGVLGHEFTHAAGSEDEKRPEQTRALLKALGWE